MITFEQARELLIRNIKLNKITKVLVNNGINYIIVEDIHSPVDLPPYTTSAMDGYAINTEYISEIPSKLKVKGEVITGSLKKMKIDPEGAIKVYTGSILPEGADAVIEIERVKFSDNYIILNEKPKKWENVRFQGEEVKKGEKVLERGTKITPPVAAFLSIMGMKYVKVYRKPEISVVITGSEIVEPGRRLKLGQVYDANSTSLYTSLSELGIEPRIIRIKDDFNEIRKAYKRAYRSSDMIIFSGGISVGEYDMVRILVEKENVNKIFYKVKQKPGKPLFFGEKGGKYIFGIPGNPASVLTCYYEYVLPAIKKMMGFKEIFLKEEEKFLFCDIKKKSDRLYFLRGKIDGDWVMPLKNQESHMLSSFALADCLILAPEGIEFIKKGEKVKIHRL